jgi:hypothetical protein
MKIYVVNTSSEFFWFYATKKEAMKKIKLLKKEADIENAKYKKSRDSEIIVTGGTNKVWAKDYDHIDINTYEFEPNKKGLIHAMQDGLGLVSRDSVGDTNE